LTIFLPIASLFLNFRFFEYTYFYQTVYMLLTAIPIFIVYTGIRKGWELRNLSKFSMLTYIMMIPLTYLYPRAMPIMNMMFSPTFEDEVIRYASVGLSIAIISVYFIAYSFIAVSEASKTGDAELFRRYFREFKLSIVVLLMGVIAGAPSIVEVGLTSGAYEEFGEFGWLAGLHFLVSTTLIVWLFIYFILINNMKKSCLRTIVQRMGMDSAKSKIPELFRESNIQRMLSYGALCASLWFLIVLLIPVLPVVSFLIVFLISPFLLGILSSFLCLRRRVENLKVLGVKCGFVCGFVILMVYAYFVVFDILLSLEEGEILTLILNLSIDISSILVCPTIGGFLYGYLKNKKL